MQQVQFHPGSSLDGHAVVLSSDNFLRIYNVDEDRTTPEQSIALSANNREEGNSCLSEKYSDFRESS